jgi:hypothetical protein
MDAQGETASSFNVDDGYSENALTRQRRDGATNSDSYSYSYEHTADGRRTRTGHPHWRQPHRDTREKLREKRGKKRGDASCCEANRSRALRPVAGAR